jgi:hypothetical protein
VNINDLRNVGYPPTEPEDDKDDISAPEEFIFLGTYDDDGATKPRYFYLSKDQKINWNYAAQYCTNNGGHLNLEFASLTMSKPSRILVLITDLFESDKSQVSDMVHVNGKTDSNNKEKSSFFWAKNPKIHLGQTRWAKDEPNNENGYEDCVSIMRFRPGIFYSLEYGFADVSCNSLGQVLCEKV